MSNRILTGTDKGVGYHARHEFPIRFESDARRGEFAGVTFKIWKKQVFDTHHIFRARFQIERATVDLCAIKPLDRDEIGIGCSITPHNSLPVQPPRTNSPRIKTGIWEFPLGMKLIVEPTAWDQKPETVEDYTR